jgi:thiol-disulfide isomerase/thioredoxin
MLTRLMSWKQQMNRQVWSGRRWIGLVAVCALLAAAGSIAPARATRADSAEDIVDARAAALHRDNVGSGNYTEWVGGKLGKRPDGLPRYLTVGEKMPDFDLKVFGGVQTVRSRSLKAPYMLNIWASWCPPCREEFPLLSSAASKGDLPFNLYFVNTSDTLRRANNFMRTQRTGLDVLFDPPPGYAFNDLVGIRVIPDSLLVGPDGTLLAIHIGEMRTAALEFFKAVAANPGVGSYNAEGALRPREAFRTAGVPPLISGVTYTGTLNDKLPYEAFSYAGTADEPLVISMRATGTNDAETVDPYLVILNSAGEVVAFDDDSGALVTGDSALNTGAVVAAGEGLDRSAGDALVRITLPATDTYTIIVARAGYEDGLNEGSYQLTFINEAAFF